MSMLTSTSKKKNPKQIKAINVDVAAARVFIEQNICKLSECLLNKFQFLLSGASAQPHYLFIEKKGLQELELCSRQK